MNYQAKNQNSDQSSQIPLIGLIVALWKEEGSRTSINGEPYALFPIPETSLPHITDFPHGELQMQGKIILIVIMTALFIIPILADIPVEGIKQYNYQYVINNTADFPDYVFLTSSEIWGFEHPARVINGTFGGGYKLDGFVLHAMKGADLDSTIKEQIDTPEQIGKNLSAYFASAPLATSDIVLPVSTGMNDTIPLNNITILLDVQEINGSVLNITKVKTQLGFENGTIQEEINNEENDAVLPGEEDLDLLHLI